MQDEIEKREAERWKMLKEFYDLSKGNTYRVINMWKVGEALGFDKEITEITFQYLLHEGLLKAVAIGGIASIAHYGLKEVERKLKCSSEPTDHFSINVLSIAGDVVSSQIQQGSPGGQQMLTLDQRSSIEEILKKIDGLLPQIPNEEKKSIETDSGNCEAQLRKSQPSILSIKESSFFLMNQNIPEEITIIINFTWVRLKNYPILFRVEGGEESFIFPPLFRNYLPHRK